MVPFAYLGLVLVGMVASMAGSVVTLIVIAPSSSTSIDRIFNVLVYAFTRGLIGSLIVSAVATTFALLLFSNFTMAALATLFVAFCLRILVSLDMK